MQNERQTNRDATTHRPTDAERGLAPAKGQVVKPAPKPPAKVDMLYLHHSKNERELEVDQAFGRLRFPSATRRRVKNWTDLAAKLKGKQIGTLVLMTHGVPGGLLLDKWKGGADAGAFLKKTGAQVDKILFEGCMIMRSPVEAAQLSAGLQAKSATGYTWWHYTAPRVWKLNKKPAPEKLKSEIGLWVTDTAKFLIRTKAGTLKQPGTKEEIIEKLEASVTKKGGSIRLYVEWFHPDQKGGSQPDPSERPREDLIQESLDTKSDATTFAKRDHANLGAVELTIDVAKVA